MNCISAPADYLISSLLFHNDHFSSSRFIVLQGTIMFRYLYDLYHSLHGDKGITLHFLHFQYITAFVESQSSDFLYVHLWLFEV